jgi:hypothetical protein
MNAFFLFLRINSFLCFAQSPNYFNLANHGLTSLTTRLTRKRNAGTDFQKSAEHDRQLKNQKSRLSKLVG